MELWKILLLIVVSFFAGFFNVMAGGGSLLTLPVMIFLGIEGSVANGTNRVAILAQSVTAVLTFLKKGYFEFKRSLSLSLCTLPGVVIGAYYGTKLQGAWFNRVLALLMFILMILMSRDSKKEPDLPEAPPPKISSKRLFWAHLSMLFVGLYGGFIQVGVGLLLMVILKKILGLDLIRVNMHKLFIVGFYTCVAIAIFGWKNQILWWTGFYLSIGYALGGIVGSEVSIKKGESTIKMILNLVLLVMIFELLWTA